MVSILLDIVYTVLLTVLSPWILYRILLQGRYRDGWKERFGFVPRRYSNQPCIWIHAVSMGEINAIGSLVKQLQKVLPQYEIVVSSTTDTGMDRAKKLYGSTHRVFFFPWDFSWAVKRALNRLRPDLCIMMELEIWPNFTKISHRRKIPVIVANGRISSDKGFPRYKRFARLVRPIFRKLALVLAQDEMYAERFLYLGVPKERLKTVGSLKYDTAEVGEKVAGAAGIADKLLLKKGLSVIVAGSTGPGEEEIILRCYTELRDKYLKNKALQLIIVPRKPERFDQVAGLIQEQGLECVRFSEANDGKCKCSDNNNICVILGDTMGDLRKFYSLADVVFVGRSLVPMGGSDMIEAAALGKPVIVGPYTDNFVEMVKTLQNGEGIEIVANGEQLTKILSQYLNNKALRKSVGIRAQQVVRENQGATQRSAEAIVELLGYQKAFRNGGIATEMAATSDD